MKKDKKTWTNNNIVMASQFLTFAMYSSFLWDSTQNYAFSQFQHSVSVVKIKFAPRQTFWFIHFPLSVEIHSENSEKFCAFFLWILKLWKTFERQDISFPNWFNIYIWFDLSRSFLKNKPPYSSLNSKTETNPDQRPKLALFRP